jgi:hypothetical protein
VCQEASRLARSRIRRTRVERKLEDREPSEGLGAPYLQPSGSILPALTDDRLTFSHLS